jgi:hypothetical protein
MALFAGKVGVELPGSLVNGVWTADIEERDFKGQELNQVRSIEAADKVNPDYRLQNRISLVAHPYLVENLAKIKYVKVEGVRWIVNSVEREHPRLILSLGGVYDGKTPDDPPGSP